MNEIIEFLKDVHSQFIQKMISGNKRYLSEHKLFEDFDFLVGKNLSFKKDWMPSEKQYFIEKFDESGFTEKGHRFKDGIYTISILDTPYTIGIMFICKFDKVSGFDQYSNPKFRVQVFDRIKKLNWLVANNKIDLGLFICLTNDLELQHFKSHKTFKTFEIHQNKKYPKGEVLPHNQNNPRNAVKTKAECDVEFVWNFESDFPARSLGDRKSIKDNYQKLGILQPLFFTKPLLDPTKNEH